MKKIIYTVIALGVTFDASAMEKQSILGVNGMEERSNFGAIQQVPSQTSSSSIKAFEPAKKRRRKSMDKSKSSVVTRLQEQRHKKTLQEQLDEEAEVNVAFENAQKGIEMTKQALSYISSVRSRLGAYQNRLEHNASSNDVSSENMTASYSRIMDVDMAEEMTEYTTQQVLSQSGISMLSQANERPSQILQLLQ